MVKNRNVRLIAIVLVFMLCVCIVYTIFYPRTRIYAKTARLVYLYTDREIDIQLSSEESLIVKTVLNGKRQYSIPLFGEPSCGFSEDVSIRFGELVFCIACDHCGIIKLGNRYIYISETERELINRIFEKYGGSFPCV